LRLKFGKKSLPLSLDDYSKTRPEDALARGTEGNTAAWKVKLSLGLRRIPWRNPGEVELNIHAVVFGED